MGWITLALLLGFFFCCCADAYCPGIFRDPLTGTLLKWDQISGTWTIDGSYRITSSSTNAMILAKDWETTTAGGALFGIVSGGSHAMRFIFAYTDASNYSFWEFRQSGGAWATNRVGFVIAGVESFPPYSHAFNATTSAADQTICWSEEDILIGVSLGSYSGYRWKNVRGVAAGRIGFATTTGAAYFGATVRFSTPSDHNTYDELEVQLNADCPCCPTCLDQCDPNPLPETIEVTIPYGIFDGGSGISCDQCNDSFTGTFVLSRIANNTFPFEGADDVFNCNRLRYLPCQYYYELPTWECDYDCPGGGSVTVDGQAWLTAYFISGVSEQFPGGTNLLGDATCDQRDDEVNRYLVVHLWGLADAVETCPSTATLLVERRITWLAPVAQAGGNCVFVEAESGNGIVAEDFQELRDCTPLSAAVQRVLCRSSGLNPSIYDPITVSS